MSDQLNYQPDFSLTGTTMNLGVRLNQLWQIWADQGAQVLDLRSVSAPEFEAQIAQKVPILEPIRALIKARTSDSAPALVNAIARYEVEYATGPELVQLFEDTNTSLEAAGLPSIPYSQEVILEALGNTTNYSYWTPSMDPQVFAELVGEVSPTAQILDVGAGSGDLLKTIISWGFDPSQLTGVDISPTSASRIAELACQAFQGRLEDFMNRVSQKFDLIFLSYFIDRDADQIKTFTAAIQALEEGGTLMLEGLFPCETFDPSGLQYAGDSSKIITKGRDAVQDIDLVITELEQIALSLGKKLVVTKIATGVRKVWSRDGLEELSSDIICLKLV